MSITDYQREICRIIAVNRVTSGESYIAGGIALNTLVRSPRLSQDIDIFHDVQEAVIHAWQSDNILLVDSGYDVRVRVQLPTFIEAIVTRGSDSVLVQWLQDSAYRFFPLQEHPLFGLTLHPFDLATNKVLALVGRLEPRDWIDVILCDSSVQKLGYLAWAAAGKDPGLSPAFILEQARRSARYTQAEIDALSFSEPVESAEQLSRRWKEIVDAAQRITDRLPAEEAGKCVIDVHGDLLQAEADVLPELLSAGLVQFHSGAIRGAYPQIKF